MIANSPSFQKGWCINYRLIIFIVYVYSFSEHIKEKNIFRFFFKCFGISLTHYIYIHMASQVIWTHVITFTILTSLLSSDAPLMFPQRPLRWAHTFPETRHSLLCSTLGRQQRENIRPALNINWYENHDLAIARSSFSPADPGLRVLAFKCLIQG